uniref:Uncharacterized protein n=1 Tax=Avena sativa TaxID=4498 RepID=A0ACD5TZT0_AVESA
MPVTRNEETERERVMIRRPFPGPVSRSSTVHIAAGRPGRWTNRRKVSPFLFLHRRARLTRSDRALHSRSSPVARPASVVRPCQSGGDNCEGSSVCTAPKLDEPSRRPGAAEPDRTTQWRGAGQVVVAGGCCVRGLAPPASEEESKTIWGDEAIDLKDPPQGEQGSDLSFVLLTMDSKTICRTKVSDVPDTIKVPSIWTIIKFVPNREYRQSDFLKFSLLPDPEDDHQTKEWERFLCYLCSSGKDGIVKFRSGTFYILAPKPRSFSHVVILYETGLKEPGVYKNMAGLSGRSNRNEEICDNKPHPNLAVTKRESTPTRNFVSTDPNYIQTLSQTHAGWIFGAIAELIDNSRDAGASRLDISIQYMFSKQAGGKVPVLCVVDNGHGMTYAEMMRMVSFGHKRPDEHIKDQIGTFGIGFKTGAMKLGRDAVVLTQTSNSRSVSFLSQSFNKNKDILEIPVVTYCKKGQYMQFDLNMQSEVTAEYNLNAIKEFSPFNEYVIGEKVALFGEEGTGTQVYIWNLDTWGTGYTLEWDSEKTDENSAGHGNGDILIRSKRVRSRPGQTTGNVPLDYSLKAYLEVMFMNPQMKITVQGSQVIICHLEKTLQNTSVLSGEIMGKTIQLTLGRSDVEWGRMNCGIFLYWHGRLIESYKRVGGQKHNADMGRGIIGVADITDLIDDENGNTWVLNSKQGFQDCEIYAKLEEWLGRKTDEYWDTNFDRLNLRKSGDRLEAVDDWVQCYSCRKWRMLNAGFNIESLPSEWFCHLPPFNGRCEIPEEQMEVGVITVAEKRSGHNKAAQPEVQRSRQDEDAKNVRSIQPTANKGKRAPDATGSDDSSQDESGTVHPPLKRPARGRRAVVSDDSE